MNASAPATAVRTIEHLIQPGLPGLIRRAPFVAGEEIASMTVMSPSSGRMGAWENRFALPKSLNEGLAYAKHDSALGVRVVRNEGTSRTHALDGARNLSEEFGTVATMRAEDGALWNISTQVKAVEHDLTPTNETAVWGLLEHVRPEDLGNGRLAEKSWNAPHPDLVAITDRSGQHIFHT